MITIEQQIEMRDKILRGLEIAYQKLLVFKKQKNSPLVIMKDGKITHVMVK
jgi:hypothetical protein